MDQSIKAGVYGFLLALVIDAFSPIYLYFIPSFLVAIFVIFVFRLGTLKDGLVATFMTYLFSDGVFGTIVLATYYFENEPYPSYNVDVLTALYPMVSAATAVIAGYIGVWLAQKRKPPQEFPTPIPQQSPPV
jgi:uncharacterized membrane protein YfcA